MGQKVNPIGFRLGVNRGWDSVWYAKKKDFGNYLIEDFKIRAYIKNEDMLILISSSGTSDNIVNAAKYCKDNKISLITLSGFDINNPLSQLGNVNIHVPSDKYNFIEMSHHIILVSIVDIFAENLF